MNQLTSQGTWAEYVRVPYWNVARKPEFLDFNEAASVPYTLTGATEILKAFSQGESILLSPRGAVPCLMGSIRGNPRD